MVTCKGDSCSRRAYRSSRIFGGDGGVKMPHIPEVLKRDTIAMPERNVSLKLMQKADSLAPGQMGSVRSSMFHRETLIRPPLGAHFTRGRSLPPAGFVYGKPCDRDPEGINKCLNWSTTKAEIRHSAYGVDYKKTNIESVKNGIHAVPVWMRFRKEKDYRRRPVELVVKERKPKLPIDMTFGKPNRPSTPLGCLLSHYYKREFDRKAIERNRTYLTDLAIARSSSPQPYDSLKSVNAFIPLGSKPKSAAAAAELEKAQGPRKFWTMRRFQSQGPRISTHWSPEDAKRIKERLNTKPACDLSKYK